MRAAKTKAVTQEPHIYLPAFQKNWHELFETLKQVSWNLFLIAAGSIIFAIGVNGILVPHKFLSGGLTGLSLTLNYIFPSLPVSGLLFAMNVPIFAIGWMYVGRRFFLYSLAGMVIFSVAIGSIHLTIPVNDKILGAILAGIISGIGWGITLESLGCAGGMDIVSIILLKRFNIRLGTSVLVSNAIVLALAANFFSLENALYTMIYLYVTSKALNIVIYGLSQRKSVYIISEKWETIYHEIMENVHRGVTILEGRGGYTGNQIQMLFTVVSFQELSRLKKIIGGLDPNAFVVVSDTLEVMGKRIGNQPRW